MAREWQARVLTLVVGIAVMPVRTTVASYTIECIAAGVELNQPTWVAQAPGDHLDF